MNALSNMGLLSRFVGMITDSRSFLSYSRHDYFRRLLCNLLGHDVRRGLVPDDRALLRPARAQRLLRERARLLRVPPRLGGCGGCVMASRREFLSGSPASAALPRAASAAGRSAAAAGQAVQSPRRLRRHPLGRQRPGGHRRHRRPGLPRDPAPGERATRSASEKPPELTAVCSTTTARAALLLERQRRRGARRSGRSTWRPTPRHARFVAALGRALPPGRVQPPQGPGADARRVDRPSRARCSTRSGERRRDRACGSSTTTTCTPSARPRTRSPRCSSYRLRSALLEPAARRRPLHPGRRRSRRRRLQRHQRPAGRRASQGRGRAAARRTPARRATRTSSWSSAAARSTSPAAVAALARGRLSPATLIAELDAPPEPETDAQGVRSAATRPTSTGKLGVAVLSGARPSVRR